MVYDMLCIVMLVRGLCFRSCLCCSILSTGVTFLINWTVNWWATPIMMRCDDNILVIYLSNFTHFSYTYIVESWRKFIKHQIILRTSVKGGISFRNSRNELSKVTDAEKERYLCTSWHLWYDESIRNVQTRISKYYKSYMLIFVVGQLPVSRKYSVAFIQNDLSICNISVFYTFRKLCMHLISSMQLYP